MNGESGVLRHLNLIGAAALWAAAAGMAGSFHAGSAWAAASNWDQTEVTEVRLIAASDTVGDTDTVQLGLQFRLEPGWKIYWRSPGDAGSPPVPDYTGSTNLGDTEMSWPAPQRFFEGGGLETVGYLDGTVFPITAKLDQPGEPVNIQAVVDYQACEKICVPFTATLNLDLPAGPGEPSVFTQLINRYHARVPVEPAAAGIEIAAAGVTGLPSEQVLELHVRSDIPFNDPQLFVEGPDTFRFPAAESVVAEDGRSAVIKVAAETHGKRDLTGNDVTITLVDAERAAVFATTVNPWADAAAVDSSPLVLFSILGLALVGGLILNLMPCVLPVLSIKLLGVISHGGGRRSHVTLSFLASAAGIIVSFLVLAGAAIGLKYSGAAVGWGMQFQEPVFLVFLTIVLTLFACNLFGLFEIALPGSLGTAAARAGGSGPSLAGSFWTGAFATLLATPCSAPFLGTAVGFALSRGAGEILAVFAALGIGMAIPYLVVATFPALATRLPKPGTWMIWVRKVMGLALAVTAIWLLWVISVQAGLLAAVLIGGAMVGICVILWVWHRWGFGGRQYGAAAVAVLAIVAFLVPGRLVPPGVNTLDAAVVDAIWQPFSVSEIDARVRDGEVVFVDVTADWCVTCKVNKAVVINSSEVADRLSGPGVVPMRADWTTPNDGIAAYLASFGRYGIPFNVVYGPGAPDGLVLSELLSQGEVLDALDEAAATAQAQSN